MSKFLFNKKKKGEVVKEEVLFGDDFLCEQSLGRFQDRRAGAVPAQQILGPLLEGLGDQRRRPAEVQENQAAFHNIWMRVQLGEKGRHKQSIQQ